MLRCLTSKLCDAAKDDIDLRARAFGGRKSKSCITECGIAQRTMAACPKRVEWSVSRCVTRRAWRALNFAVWHIDCFCIRQEVRSQRRPGGRGQRTGAATGFQASATLRGLPGQRGCRGWPKSRICKTPPPLSKGFPLIKVQPRRVSRRGFFCPVLGHKLSGFVQSEAPGGRSAAPRPAIRTCAGHH